MLQPSRATEPNAGAKSDAGSEPAPDIRADAFTDTSADTGSKSAADVRANAATDTSGTDFYFLSQCRPKKRLLPTCFFVSHFFYLTLFLSPQ